MGNTRDLKEESRNSKEEVPTSNHSAQETPAPACDRQRLGDLAELEEGPITWCKERREETLNYKGNSRFEWHPATYTSFTFNHH
jgi:hypothetical protein